MAVDSLVKRKSVLGIPDYTSGISQSDRQTVLWVYGGIVAKANRGRAIGVSVLVLKSHSVDVEVNKAYSISVLLLKSHSVDVTVDVEAI